MQSTANLCRFTIRGMALPEHDWFLPQWLASTGTSQASLSRLTGWDRRKTSFLVTGRQEYRRQEVNEAAAALNCAPFELLMHPSDAMAMRQVRRAIALVADRQEDYDAAPDNLPAWGRNGTDN